MQGKITASSLNVRKGTSTSYSVVKTLRQGIVVNILDSKKVGATTWYKIKEGWISGKYVDILSDNKNEITVTPNMTMKQIQDSLEKSGCTIRFTKGVYNITKTLLLYSDTTIILDNAILVRKNSKQIFMNYLNPSRNYNYNATKNVTIKGNGKLVGNGSSKTCSIISIMHCDNFIFNGVEFTKCLKSHDVDVCGSSNIIFKNVTFSDRITDPKKTYKESVNIDFSYYSGFPYYSKTSKAYNLAHCKNVKFDTCTFSNISTAIGSHTEGNTTLKHKNIIVINCTARGDGGGNFINLSNVDGATIRNNNINGFRRGVELRNQDTYYTAKGSKTYTANHTSGCENISIEGNTISNARGDVKAAGIHIISEIDGVKHSDIVIKNNKFTLNNTYARYDIYISNTDDADIINNNTKLEVRIDKNTTNNIKVV